MNARKGFDGDLLDGAAREDAFARLLLEGREKWEHKRDFQCCETGRIALEYETSEFPGGLGERWLSGISVCEAHWFVIEYRHEHRVVLPLDYVKEQARAALKDGLHAWIGDDRRFHNAFVPLEWLFSASGEKGQVAA